MVGGPLDLLAEVTALLDSLDIPYALGGSMASSLLGEPRSTLDIDLAIDLEGAAAERLLDRAGARFYVPLTAARVAIAAHSSFNLPDTANALKVDLFVLGDGLLDRRQIERRQPLDLPGIPHAVWVTSAEDQVLRKLDWYRRSGSTSDHQWRDVLGLLSVQDLDLDDLRATAGALDLQDLLRDALSEAGLDSA